MTQKATKKNRYASGYQPTKAEMKEKVKVDCSPDELLEAVFNFSPRNNGNLSKGRKKG